MTPACPRSAAKGDRRPGAAEARPQWRHRSSGEADRVGPSWPASRRRSPPASPRSSGHPAGGAPHRKPTSSRPGSGRAGFCDDGCRWPCTASHSRAQRGRFSTRHPSPGQPPTDLRANVHYIHSLVELAGNSQNSCARVPLPEALTVKGEFAANHHQSFSESGASATQRALLKYAGTSPTVDVIPSLLRGIKQRFTRMQHIRVCV